MEEIWNRIEKWLGENAPQVLKSLQPGATDEQIQEVEKLIGVSFPKDFKESYKIHNGQIDDLFLGLIEGKSCLSLHQIKQEWSVWKEMVDGGEFTGIKSSPSGPISNDWYNLKWIPLTHNGAGDHYCLDMAPEEGGNIGQIISFWHDWEKRDLEAKSFKDWLETFANDLENNKYTVTENYGLDI